MYLIDDLIEVYESAEDFFESHISFNEACEKYSYHLINSLCSEFTLTPYYVEKDFDIIFSDKRYKYGYIRENLSFLKKKDIEATYYKWFNMRVSLNFPDLQVTNKEDLKYECSQIIDEYPIDRSNTFIKENAMSVYNKSSYIDNSINLYEMSCEYELISTVLKIWELDSHIPTGQVLNLISKHTSNININEIIYYRSGDLASLYEEAIFYNTLRGLGVNTEESDLYFKKIKQTKNIQYYFKTFNTGVLKILTPIHIDNDIYVSYQTARNWWYLYHDISYENIKHKIFNNNLYLSFNDYKSFAL